MHNPECGHAVERYCCEQEQKLVRGMIATLASALVRAAMESHTVLPLHLFDVNKGDLL